MGVLRKLAFGLLLAAAGAVLAIAGWELRSYGQTSQLPLNERGFSAPERTRILQERIDLLNRRVGDMEFLVLILLGTSGLCAGVFAATSYLSARALGRQADRTVRNLKDQIGAALDDLRRLQKDTKGQLQGLTAVSKSVPQEPLPPQEPTAWDSQIADINARLVHLQASPLTDETRLELMRHESTAACLEVMAPSSESTSLAALCLTFARIYATSDGTRSRFYLERALRFAVPQSPQASEIHYLQACRFASSRDFPRAISELTSAFAHQPKILEDRLATDIEEGGVLYELASTAPFDKTVNDLLLNMSIGIG